MALDHNELERELDSLMAAYRDAVPVPEASAEFMPKLWARIDAGQNSFWVLKRWTEGFIAAAAAACLVVFVLQVIPDDTQSAAFQASSYVEALSQEQTPDNLALQDVAAVAYPDQYNSDAGTK